MKYRLISTVLIVSFCVSNIGNATVLNDATLAVLLSWLPNMNQEVFDSAWNCGLSDPDTPHFSDDEIIEAVLAQMHYGKKHCYFHPRVPCKNGDNCKFRHDKNDSEKLREQNLAKLNANKKWKKKNEPLEIKLKDEDPEEQIEEPVALAEPAGLGPEGSESGSGGIEIFVTENGQLLEPTISQRKPCYFYGRVGCKHGDNCKFLHSPNWKALENERRETHRQNRNDKKQRESDAKLGIVVTENGQPIESNNQNLCKKKRKPRHAQQPLEINTSPLALSHPPVITQWASIISPGGQVFNLFYSYDPHRGTHIICRDRRFWDFVIFTIPFHILSNNLCRFDDPNGSVVEIGGAAAHHFMSLYS